MKRFAQIAAMLLKRQNHRQMLILRLDNRRTLNLHLNKCKVCILHNRHSQLKKKVDMLKLLPLISNTIGFVSGILSIIFGIKIKNYNNTYLGYVSSFKYGGAAYTGIQNAAADTGNNVKAVYHLIQNSAMFLLITIGLIAISVFFSKLIKAVIDFKSSE